MKRHPITRVQIFSGVFTKLCPFSVCSAAQDSMNLGKYTGCALGNQTRVSPWLPSVHHIWTLVCISGILCVKRSLQMNDVLQVIHAK
eukprot:10058533-Ditylum_brightwellii.AAC.1